MAAGVKEFAILVALILLAALFGKLYLDESHQKSCFTAITGVSDALKRALESPNQFCGILKAKINAYDKMCPDSSFSLNYSNVVPPCPP